MSLTGQCLGCHFDRVLGREGLCHQCWQKSEEDAMKKDLKPFGAYLNLRDSWDKFLIKCARLPRVIRFGKTTIQIYHKTSWGSADQPILLYPDPSEFDKRIERFYGGPRIIHVPGFDRFGRRING